jgi:hypothetical protein
MAHSAYRPSERVFERRHDSEEHDRRSSESGMAARWLLRLQLQDRRKLADRRTSKDVQDSVPDRREAS